MALFRCARAEIGNYLHVGRLCFGASSTLALRNARKRPTREIWKRGEVIFARLRIAFFSNFEIDDLSVRLRTTTNLEPSKADFI